MSGVIYHLFKWGEREVAVCGDGGVGCGGFGVGGAWARSRMKCNTYGPMGPEVVEYGRKVQPVECG